jgi:FKBP-type peptidyl-prolyl cis-trans isomerase
MKDLPLKIQLIHSKPSIERDRRCRCRRNVGSIGRTLDERRHHTKVGRQGEWVPAYAQPTTETTQQKLLALLQTTPHHSSMFSRLSSLPTKRIFTQSPQTFRQFSHTSFKMGVTKQMISPGDGQTRAQKGDTITMEYTGNLQDTSAPNGKGKQYVSIHALSQSSKIR